MLTCIVYFFLIQDHPIPVQNGVDNLPKSNLKTLDSFPAEIALCQVNDQNHISPSPALPPSPPSPPSPSYPPPPYHLDDFNPSGALLLSQKLRNLELQSRDTESDGTSRLALDPYCLLTPSKTLHIIERADLVRTDQDKWTKADNETFPWSSDGNAHDEGTVIVNIGSVKLKT